MGGICVLTSGISEFGTGDGIYGVVGAPGEVEPASAMGSREREKADVDALGVGENGDMEGGGRRSCSCSCPSINEFLRA